MSSLTREDVTSTLGRLDDIVVTAIIGTGATADELAEAKAWMINDEPLLNAGKPLASGRVREVIEILADVDSNEDQDDAERASSATS
jgi:hypothetical protein